ncbi:hypothetical protein ACFC4G_46555 [Streptomyces sp. NPDC056002]
MASHSLLPLWHDPEFGHRFLATEARSTGTGMSGRTTWRICRDNH